MLERGEPVIFEGREAFESSLRYAELHARVIKDAQPSSLPYKANPHRLPPSFDSNQAVQSTRPKYPACEEVQTVQRESSTKLMSQAHFAGHQEPISPF